jgi:hypothetical protein
MRQTKPDVPERLRHDSMHVKEFRYLRISGVSGDKWESLPKNDTVWHINFPDSAVKFRCRVSQGAEVLIQETVNPDSTTALRFRQGAHIVIVGNMLYYWEMELDMPAGTSYPL